MSGPFSYVVPSQPLLLKSLTKNGPISNFTITRSPVRVVERATSSQLSLVTTAYQRSRKILGCILHLISTACPGGAPSLVVDNTITDGHPSSRWPEGK